MSTHFPYKDFLDSEESYLATQKVWQDLINQIANVHGHQPTAYMNLQQNAKPLRDGNPLVAFSVAGKGIRIIQAAPEEEGTDFSAWFNTFGKGDPEHETEELVIDLKLTTSTLPVAAILIERWVAGELDETGLGVWLSPYGEEE